MSKAKTKAARKAGQASPKHCISAERAAKKYKLTLSELWRVVSSFSIKRVQFEGQKHLDADRLQELEKAGLLEDFRAKPKPPPTIFLKQFFKK